MDGPHQDARLWMRLPWALAAAGLVVRLVQYGWNRSFWHDEARLMMNVITRPASRLIGPLDLEQAAPPLFLWIERAAAVTMGPSELSLRLFPLLCGIAAVALVTAVAFRLLAQQGPDRPRRAAPGIALAAGLIALSPILIWHSTEAKPYSSDVLASALLWAIALGVGSRREIGACMSQRRWWLWCASAAALLWLSYPAIFVVAGIGVVELGSRLAGPAPRVRRILSFALGMALPLASFAALYWLAIRQQQQTELYEYWDDRFADFSRPWTIPWWALRGTNSVVNYLVRNAGTFLLILAAFGVAGLWRAHQRRQMWLLLAPFLLALLAGAAGQYPFPGYRLTLYLAPAICWMAGAGLNALLAWADDHPASRAGAMRWRGVISLLAIAPLGVAGLYDLYHLAVPQQRGHIRPVYEHLLARHQAGEPIAVPNGSLTLTLYQRAGGPPLSPLLNVSAGAPGAETPDQLLARARDMAGGGRFWIAFEYGRSSTRRDVMAAVRSRAPEALIRVEELGGVLLEVPPEPATTGGPGTGAAPAATGPATRPD